MGDKRPVQIVFNGNLSIASSPSSVQMLCKNGQWYDNQTGIAVVSVSCIYESPCTLYCSFPETYQEGKVKWELELK
ncbi:unnamed protein product [Angiostrongylus costaricensis]|uniref:Sushi domain-containing protein n=1 Tax=Angiostrongylus costaricensis TaxID=334426 RepID=A0A0R3PF81_ANGCS|nr:unnamed protein product [Angiostrongylus costaricensis]